MNPRELAVNAWQKELDYQKDKEEATKGASIMRALTLFEHWFGDEHVPGAAYSLRYTAPILTINGMELLYGRSEGEGFFQVRGICGSCKHFGNTHFMACWSRMCFSIQDIGEHLAPFGFKPERRHVCHGPSEEFIQRMDEKHKKQKTHRS